MEMLIDLLDQEVRSEFENSTETVIREMNATSIADPESALIYLIDAANQIAKLQRIALFGTGLKLHDERRSRCPFSHKSPKEVLEGMHSCPNLIAFAEAEKIRHETSAKVR